MKIAPIAVLAVALAAPVAAEELSLATIRAAGYEVLLADGSSRPLAELLPEGRPAVIELWATWCAPCRKMTPRMNAIHAEYAPRGVSIVGLTIERPDRDSEKVGKYVESQGVAYPVGFVPDGLYEALTGKESRSVPKVFIFDANGRLATSILSYTPWTMRTVETQVARQVRP